MMKLWKKTIPVYMAAALAGFLLHSLFQWRPCLLTAIFSPVRESIWEHMKLLFYPLLGCALYFGKQDPSVRAVRCYAALASSLLLLPAGYVLHVVLLCDALLWDVVLYLLLITLGFFLPRLLWPLGEWEPAQRLAVPLTAAFWVLLVWFSLDPPEGVLFAGSEVLRTFLTLPV